MEADLLGCVGTSNRCTVGSCVHGVVVVGHLLRGHRLMGMRGKRKAFYISSDTVRSWSERHPQAEAPLPDLTRPGRAEQNFVKFADTFNNHRDPIGHGNVPVVVGNSNGKRGGR
jgi:hypothetical protein